MLTINNTKKFNIVDNCDRKVLGEGRTKGMAFAFCKKVKDAFETVQPLSPCKDYLNDVVFIETTGIPISACGLKLNEKKDIFLDDYSYLLITTLPSNKEGKIGLKNESSYVLSGKLLADELVFMLENHKNIESYINFFEELCNIEGRTTIIMEDPYLLVKFPTYWTKSTYLISLYTYLIRISLYSDFKTNPLTELHTMEDTAKNNIEYPYLVKIIRMLDSIAYNGNSKFLEVQDLNSKQLKLNPGYIHGTGIACY